MADELPTPPWRAPRKPPKRRRLTRELIVDAALRVLDESGLDGLSMRRLADELQTGPASLYAHVADKEDLLDLILDRALAEVDHPEPDPTRWQEQIKHVLRDWHRVLLSHRDLARVGQARIPTEPNGLVAMEHVLAILRSGGLPDQVVAWAGDLLPLYVNAHAYETSLFAARQDHVAENWPESLRDYFASLPADRFPTIVALAGPLTYSASADDRFLFGLDILIQGLAAFTTTGS